MFLNQTFSIIDIPKVLLLAFLECLLSADNALVIASIVKPLSKAKREKALWIGAFSALILRGAAIVFAAYLIRFFYIQLLGAFYLIYLAFSYQIKSKKNTLLSPSPSLLRVVIQVELMDLLFAFDSIIAALGLTGVVFHKGEGFPSKIWIVYLGGILGLVMMRFSVRIFSYLMDHFPRLEKMSHYLIGWIGLKLGFEAFHSYRIMRGQIQGGSTLQLITDISFWLGAAILFSLGFFPLKKAK